MVVNKFPKWKKIWHDIRTMQNGALLIHGFTATPECLDSLVGPLCQAGFEVSMPLLAGHGSTAYDLSKTTWQDWYNSVTEAFKTLQKQCSTVCVAGLSLGGLLSLKLATEYPVERLALLATPVFLGGVLAKYALPFVGKTFLKEIYRYQPKLMGPDIADPEARKNFKSYTKMPIKSILEILALQKDVIPRLKEIQAPALIIHSPKDNTAPFANMEFIKTNLGSKIIKTITLERSNHVLTMDYEKDLVAREVIGFFE